MLTFLKRGILFHLTYGRFEISNFSNVDFFSIYHQDNA